MKPLSHWLLYNVYRLRCSHSILALSKVFRGEKAGSSRPRWAGRQLLGSMRFRCVCVSIFINFRIYVDVLIISKIFIDAYIPYST